MIRAMVFVLGVGFGGVMTARTLATHGPEGPSVRMGATPGDASTAGGADQDANVPYDGRFTFVRIRFETGGFRSFRGFGGREPPWAHDYPRAERNFEKILEATTLLHLYTEGSNILALDDPELFKFPVAYVSEPGYWTMSEAEASGLRNYLLKGGFVIFDDFRGGDWFNFEEQLRRVLPEGRLMQVPDEHAIWDSFFDIENPRALIPPTFQEYRPEYLGMFEDNDPSKRLLLIANYNNDIGDYWEWSDQGWLPIDLTNEAYKFGVNYVVYAMTH